MAHSIPLNRLPDEVNDSVHTSGKFPLLLDPLGQACQFLRYRARYLSVLRRGDFEKESLRRALVQALHNGAWLVLDFDAVAVDLDSLFDGEHFPPAVLSPQHLFLEETYEPLLRPGDEFAAKLTYEHQAALAEGAFQDRTKCHAPERVADVDRRFSPKEAFRLIVASKKGEAPAELQERMSVLRVLCSQSQAQENAGLWAGRERPRQEKSREQQKLDSELVELAFDGELAQVQKLLEKGADPAARDGHGNTALSEAACNGHQDVAQLLLDHKAPLCSDPNDLNIDGRTPLHRAAFQGHGAVVSLLLQRGADPRLKDRHGELPFDMASSAEGRQALTAWDVAKTDLLREERRAAQATEDEKAVRSEEERLQLRRRERMKALAGLAEKGDHARLEEELPENAGSYRDDRGNTLLHIAAEQGHLETAAMLVGHVDVNCRDAKGWTPVAIAAFKGHKKLCASLLAHKADPLLENAYRKDAFALARDDEIREALRGVVAPAAEAPKAKAKAKGRAKSRAASGSATRAKAAAKPRGKSKPR